MRRGAYRSLRLKERAEHLIRFGNKKEKERSQMKQRTAAMLTALALAGISVCGCGSMYGDAPAQSGTQGENRPGETSGETEDAHEKEAGEQGKSDRELADEVAALIDAIYVQERTDDTDAQCEAAKEAWDALTDAQKALVEGEEAGKGEGAKGEGAGKGEDTGIGEEAGTESAEPPFRVEFFCAQRLEDGRRTFKMVQHAPELTSFGLDLYDKIIPAPK